MDLINDIKTLAEIMKKNDVTRLEYEEGHTHITLERGSAGVVPVLSAPTAPVAPVAAVPAAVSGGNDAPAESAPAASNVHAVKSPMVGVFYAAKAPGEKPFVKEGDHVTVGQVLCIVEAMKLMNDITSDAAGIVKRVCVKDGEVVEFGQTLFELE